MKKVFYILGSIEIILGLLTLVFTTVLQEVVPMIGMVAFQGAAAGGYSPDDYAMNLALPNSIAIGICLLGLGSILYCCFSKGER